MFLIALAVSLAVATNNVAEGITDWDLSDMDVYHDAAMRLRSGQDLYGGEVGPFSAYRYAPWFAYAWVPVTHLPVAIERLVWAFALVAATGFVIRPLLRATREHLLLVLLLGSALFGVSTQGNVQALMLAILVLGIETRWGWAAVGLAASLKVVPIAFVGIFIARRQWGQAIGAVGLAAALWAPILVLPVSGVTFDAGAARLFPTPLWATAALTAGAVVAWLAWRRSRLTEIAAPVAALVALPRLYYYEMTLLLVPCRVPRQGLSARRREGPRVAGSGAPSSRRLNHDGQVDPSRTPPIVAR